MTKDSNSFRRKAEDRILKAAYNLALVQQGLVEDPSSPTGFSILCGSDQDSSEEVATKSLLKEVKNLTIGIFKDAYLNPLLPIKDFEEEISTDVLPEIHEVVEPLTLRLSSYKEQGEIRIGRMKTNNFIIDDESVSRNHVVLQMKDNMWYVKSLSPCQLITNSKVLYEITEDFDTSVCVGNSLKIGRTRINIVE